MWEWPALPSLDVRYYPETSGRSINVTFRWPEVSGRTVEAEATSKIEGVLSGIRNCSSISSSSSTGTGKVSLTFDKGTDMQAARFEVASRIRNLYPSLPEGVSYPAISLGVRGHVIQDRHDFCVQKSAAVIRDREICL